MSGIMALRNAARRSPTAFNMLRATYSTTNISGGSMGKAWSDKEHAAESQYFNQQDAKMLEKLAKKLQTQTTPDDSVIASAKTELTTIFASHNVTATDALIEDVIKFKFNKA